MIATFVFGMLAEREGSRTQALIEAPGARVWRREIAALPMVEDAVKMEIMAGAEEGEWVTK